MSIFAAIVKAAVHLSEITEEELATWRGQASQETGDDYLRLIRERQLASWTGSSTPITQQISNSEQDLDRLLEAAVPDLKKLLPRLFAIELKQDRIDRLKGARLALLDGDAVGLATISASTDGTPLVADLKIEDEVVRAVADAARALDGIDGVVNAAGIMPVEDIGATSLALWRDVMVINLAGTFLVSRETLPHLRAAGSGTIVNFASAGGLRPQGTAAIAYIASNGGVIAFTKTLAEEAAPIIRVNSVCPGTVDTPMTKDYLRNDQGEVRPQIVANYALRRYAEPSEIARAVLYLTSDDSSFVTGVALAVDGGRSFH